MTRLCAALFVSAVAFAACGPTKYDQQQTQVAITPKGSIVGRVTESTSNNPLEGVKVTAVAPGGSVSATTNADGLYEIKDVTVASSTTMLFEKEGYLRSITSATVPNGAGNAPLSGGYATLNVRMARGDGEVRGVLRLPNNTPAIGATLYVDQRNNGFDSVLTTTTDMNGNFTFKGLATSPTGVTHTVLAQWFDENGDGLVDYNAASTSVTLYGAGNIGRVFLAYSSIGQRVVATNLYSGQIGLSEDIKLTFAVPVRPAGYNGTTTRQFYLTNNSRSSVEVALDQTWTSPVEATLKATAPLREGDIYTLAINVQSSVGGPFSTTVQFQVRPANVTGPATAVTNVSVLNDGNIADRTKFNYNNGYFVVQWDVQAAYLHYFIYAKDTSFNPAFVRVADVNLNPGTGRASYAFYVPGAFGNQPLSNGNKVTFAVVAVDQYGNTGLLSAATPVVVQDNVPPSTSPGSVTNADSAEIDGINDEASPRQVRLRISYSEPMDPAVAPVFKSTATGTIAQNFVWEQGSTSGILTLIVPPTTGDITGTFVISGGKDAAGNSLSGAEYTGSLGGRKELLTNGGFEDAAGACSLTGWVPAQTSMPTAALAAGAGVESTGRCAAVIGAPIGSQPAVGTASLTKEVTIPVLTNTQFSVQFHYAARLQILRPTVYASALQQCDLLNAADAVVTTFIAQTSASSPVYTQSTLGLGQTYGGQTLKVRCKVENTAVGAAPVNAAIYMDDFSVSLVKPTNLNQ